MKILHFSILVITCFTCAVYCDIDIAAGQGLESNNENIQFIPLVPTQDSNVEVSIRVPSLDLYCLNYLLEHSISNHELVFNIKTKSNPAEKCPGPTGSDIFLTENLGHLDPGVYDAKLLINGTQKIQTILDISQSAIEITATGSYTDQQGFFHIVGEVKNTGKDPLRLVQLDVNFESGDQIMVDKTIYTTMAVLMSGQSSGFDLLVDREDLATKQYFVRSMSYMTDTDQLQQGLKLDRLSSWQASSGFGIVSGAVSNYAQSDANQVKIVCVLYDQTKNRVLDSVFDYASPMVLHPGQTANFTLSSHYPIQSEFTSRCNAESDGIVMFSAENLPELPFELPVLLVGIMSMVLVYKVAVKK